MTIRSLILLAANFAYLQPTEPPVVFPSGTVLAYSGSDVLYTVPANTWFLQIKLWGVEEAVQTEMLAMAVEQTSYSV